MRRPWLLPALILAAVGVAVGLAVTLDPFGGERAAAPRPATPSVTAPAPAPADPEVRPERATVPETARAVLAEIRARGGEPPLGHVGGRVFQNRERRLPRGSYREYDVHPRVPGRDRGPERLVVEQRTGTAYYTGDHYRTFARID